jgi:putative toxin-antitoxin system antitoxin component (TIGR02293 family)
MEKRRIFEKKRNMGIDNLTFRSLDNNDVFKLINTTREGIDYKEFNEFSVTYPLNATTWSKILNMSERTIQRYKREKKRFGSIHTEKLLIIMLLFKKGSEVFGNTKNFLTWINSENIALGGVKPIDLLDNSFGINLVKDELIKIEHGVLA